MVNTTTARLLMVVTGGGDAAGFIVWMVQTVKIVMLQLKTKDTAKQMDMGAKGAQVLESLLGILPNMIMKFN